MQSILIIKHGALGDFVMALGFMQHIREEHPDAHLTLMTTAGMVKMAEQTGWFNEIIIDNRSRYNLKEWYRVCKKVLADRPFDAIYDLQSSGRTWGRYYKIARFLTRHPLAWYRKKTNKLLVCYQTPDKKPFWYGRATVTESPLKLPPVDLSFCHGKGENFNLLPDKYVLMIPGCSAGHPFKRWPAESYRRVSEWLGKQGIKSVVLGTTLEKEAIDSITKDNPYTVNFMNKSSLLDIPDLARRSLLTIGNDTGPVHMATFTKTKVIIFFCDINKKAAPKKMNVTNFIAPKIEDTPVEQVLETLSKELKEHLVTDRTIPGSGIVATKVLNDLVQDR